MGRTHNDNVSNESENNDIDNGYDMSKIRLTNHQIGLYEEFLTAGYRTYSNLAFLNLACDKFQDFMYRWQDLNEEERRYLAEMLPYNQYLDSPYWHYVSLVYKCRANFCCERCGGKRRAHLALHHKTYKHIGSELQYPEDMEVLCSKCHMREHGIEGNDNE